MTCGEVRNGEANRSAKPLASLADRFVALEANTTVLPSGATVGANEAALPVVEDEPRMLLTSATAPVPELGLRTWNTSVPPLASLRPVTRLVASLSKATTRPSRLMVGSADWPLPVVVVLPAVWLTRKFVPVLRSNRNTSSAALV